MRALVLGTVILAGALAGCGDDDDESDVSPQAAAAVADLAGRTGVDESVIEVVEDREVTWPDASLGCPEPGATYIQVLTDGFLVVLEADGQRYEYHGGDPLTYCPTPTAPTTS